MGAASIPPPDHSLDPFPEFISLCCFGSQVMCSAHGHLGQGSIHNPLRRQSYPQLLTVRGPQRKGRELVSIKRDSCAVSFPCHLEFNLHNHPRRERHSQRRKGNQREDQVFSQGHLGGRMEYQAAQMQTGYAICHLAACPFSPCMSDLNPVPSTRAP